MRKEISGDVKELIEKAKVTKKQKVWLSVYNETLNFGEACRRSNIDKTHVIRSLRSNTQFAMVYEQIISNIDKDPRFNKAGTLGMLVDLKERAREAGNMVLELKIVQEINKMIHGNIAATQKEITKKDIKLKGVIDLTKPVKKQPQVVDIDYTEVTDGDN